MLHGISTFILELNVHIECERSFLSGLWWMFVKICFSSTWWQSRVSFIGSSNSPLLVIFKQFV